MKNNFRRTLFESSSFLLRKFVRGILLEYPQGKCAKCGKANQTKKFCTECGSKMGFCPNPDCGEPLNDKPSQKFCTKCGEKFALDESAVESSNKSENDLADKAKKIADATLKSMQLLKKKEELSKELSIALNARIEAFREFNTAVSGDDDTALEAAKKKVKAANAKVKEAMASDREAAAAWIDVMQNELGQKLPNSFLDVVSTNVGETGIGDIDAYLDDQIEKRKELRAKTEELKRKAEEARASRAEYRKELDKMMEDLLSKKYKGKDIESSEVQKDLDTQKQKSSKLIENIKKDVEEQEKLLKTQVDFYKELKAASSQSPEKPSEAEKKAWEKIYEPFARELDKITEQYDEITDRLTDAKNSTDEAKIYQELKQFTTGVYRPQIKQFQPTMIEFYNAVKDAGETPSKPIMQNILEMIEGNVRRYQLTLENAKKRLDKYTTLLQKIEEKTT